ncbi:hypothetical protein BC351_20265 [Paenibacillus ferrarius]|uniref:Uncharacterized protein n=1 Tax=Paenibacillus ferrarius TaxID=1469647 RepID=A0A1V4HN47_9BACL|nr:hypothetical protein [Paenibacillus ferrarius]OPH59255.1 hypothetical protein BC351_20265 [Paenibacillus ferrarius]
MFEAVPSVKRMHNCRLIKAAKARARRHQGNEEKEKEKAKAKAKAKELPASRFIYLGDSSFWCLGKTGFTL